jgi:hypothetical protein
MEPPIWKVNAHGRELSFMMVNNGSTQEQKPPPDESMASVDPSMEIDPTRKLGLKPATAALSHGASMALSRTASSPTTASSSSLSSTTAERGSWRVAPKHTNRSSEIRAAFGARSASVSLASANQPTATTIPNLTSGSLTTGVPCPTASTSSPPLSPSTAATPKVEQPPIDQASTETNVTIVVANEEQEEEEEEEEIPNEVVVVNDMTRLINMLHEFASDPQPDKVGGQWTRQRCSGAVCKQLLVLVLLY